MSLDQRDAIWLESGERPNAIKHAASTAHDLGCELSIPVADAERVLDFVGEWATATRKGMRFTHLPGRLNVAFPAIDSCNTNLGPVVPHDPADDTTATHNAVVSHSTWAQATSAGADLDVRPGVDRGLLVTVGLFTALTAVWIGLAWKFWP